MKEKEIKELYNKYVKSKKFYRVVSREYLEKIKENGLEPSKNPFEKNKKELRKVFNIIEKLEKKGYVIKYNWPFETVKASRVLEVLRKDLRKKYIDLNPDKKHNKYYEKQLGGSLVFTVRKLIEEVFKKKFPLKEKEKILMDKVLKWCDERQKYGMVSLEIRRDCSCLEKAHFQHFNGKYWKSCFGSYENFKKVISKDFEKYKEYLDGKLFYLRVFERVEDVEISFLPF
jgi:hypothetical protein